MNKLKELRESKNISQLELSKILKMSRTNICMYESDTRQISKNDAYTLGKFFEIRPNDLLNIPLTFDLLKFINYNVAFKRDEQMKHVSAKIHIELTDGETKDVDIQI